QYHAEEGVPGIGSQGCGHFKWARADGSKSVVQRLHNAFAAIGTRPLEVAATLRANPWDTFFSVVLPLAKP
ncbi:hypothetical protein QCD79_34780, partial [Pseudomonas quasicaspiana]|nr:hypothetical protein [Pseudomonas quasicaspiana]